ncbi:MAG: response regulator transcription factor [Burkholderiaceae bacterium]
MKTELSEFQSLATKPVETILIVDDHPMLVWSLDSLLRSLLPSCTISTASDAQTMRNRLAVNPHYDCIFLDLSLPDAIGLEALEQCRRHAPLSPVVVFTGTAYSKDRAECFKAGARAFIQKSSSHQELYAAIENLFKSGALASGAVRNLTVFSENESLTPRLREIAEHLVKGHSNRHIAKEMGLALGTIKVHVSTLLRVLKATNRTEAAVILKNPGKG